MSDLENMKNRRSVRTYNSKPIGKEDYTQIEAYIGNSRNLTGPFGNAVSLALLHMKNNGQEIQKIGTYGSIRGANTFVASIAPGADDAIVDCGYVLEKFILFATGLNLGTCWLGAFGRSDIARLIEVKNGSIAPAITPVGYAADRRRMYESLMRGVSGANSRKPWREIFFVNDFATPIEENGAGSFNIPLAMVRAGPSASNRQPWRLVLTDTACHFYLEHSPRYIGNSLFGFDMQRLDMGIAMCHFELSCTGLEIAGKWVREEPGFPKEKEPVYIASWVF